jgi:hypothetical protein
MTILLELDPETEARLKALADRGKISPEQYATEFLRDGLSLYSTGSGRLQHGDVEKMTAVMTSGSEKLPILPAEVNNRESYYEDRW